MKTREQLLERIFYKMMMIGNEDEYLYRPLEKQDVYYILNAPTEEQQKCGYCHRSELAVMTDELYKFNYCPMCGRRLSDE